MQGIFTFPSNVGLVKGLFNIYQGRNGGIYLAMNYNAVQLTIDQITSLQINLYCLKDFDQQLYDKQYLLSIIE